MFASVLHGASYVATSAVTSVHISVCVCYLLCNISGWGMCVCMYLSCHRNCIGVCHNNSDMC